MAARALLAGRQSEVNREAPYYWYRELSLLLALGISFASAGARSAVVCEGLQVCARPPTVAYRSCRPQALEEIEIIGAAMVRSIWLVVRRHAR